MENVDNQLYLNGKKSKVNGRSLKTITDDELAIILHKHKCWTDSNGEEGEQADLRKTDLSRRNFSNVNLQDAKLSGASLYSANLENANLKSATLRGTLLIKANLDSADFTGAIMEIAQLRKASCMWTRFDCADISRANFELAEIEYASFVGVKTGKKSLEEILVTAKVNNISIDSFSRKEQLIKIVEDDEHKDDDELFNLDAHYLTLQQLELSSEKANLRSKQQELNAKENNLKKKEEQVTNKQKELDSREQDINSLIEKVDTKEEHLREQEVKLDEGNQEFPWITKSNQNLGVDDELLNRTKEPLKANQPITLLNRVGVGGHFNFRAIGVMALVLGFLMAVILSNMGRESSVATRAMSNKELEIPSKTENAVAVDGEETAPEEIPYSLELDANKVEENPVVVLAVGNVTILELEQVPKDIIVGDKEAVEVKKSVSSPKRLYLTGKATTGGSNIVIETASRPIGVFFEVVEDGSIGSFNGQVKVISKKD